jgi:transcriptional regulator of acetoin/glycerol metabolism
LLGDAGAIGRNDLRFDAAPHAVATDESMLSLRALERRHIERVLLAAGGKVEEAARRLAIPRSTLYQKLRDYGLTPSKG